MPAKDPICGMMVETQGAKYTLTDSGATVYFCADACRQRYRAAHPAATTP
ncbi:MAG: hypothetical protein ACREBT_01330 [Thermoplasmata archaeon]